MKQKILLLIVLIVGAYLRLFNLSSRVPFDWDQERDMNALSAIVFDHKPTLVGPVVRGEGGFMLGPLYTYLLIPSYLISRGNPLSAPITNIILDLVVGAGLYFLAIPAGIIWLLSPLIISQSLIAWNVGLIPLWTLVGIILLRKYQKDPQHLIPLASLLGGLAWHVHASLIPLTFIIIPYLLIRYRSKLTFHTLLFTGAAFLLPLTPLIFFDLRHEFINYHLLINFFRSPATVKPEAWFFVVAEVAKKFVLYLSQIFSPRSNYWVGLFLIIMIAVKSNKYILAFTALILLSLVGYRNPFFPGYYLTALLVPFIYVLGTFIDKLNKHKVVIVSLIILTLLLVDYGLVSEKSVFSLAAKEKIVQLISQEKTPIDLRYELSPGRDNGFAYLLSRSGVTLDRSSTTHAVLKDTASLPNRLDNREPDLFIPLSPYQLEIYRPR